MASEDSSGVKRATGRQERGVVFSRQAVERIAEARMFEAKVRNMSCPSAVTEVQEDLVCHLRRRSRAVWEFASEAAVDAPMAAVTGPW